MEGEGVGVELGGGGVEDGVLSVGGADVCVGEGEIASVTASVTASVAGGGEVDDAVGGLSVAGVSRVGPSGGGAVRVKSVSGGSSVFSGGSSVPCRGKGIAIP